MTLSSPNQIAHLRELLAKAEGKKLFTPEHADLLGALKENLPALLDTAERANALEAENKRLREERKAIIAALAPYPFCRHPTKCTKGRCEAEFCCND